MKIKINQRDDLNIVTLLRRCGYAEFKDRRAEQISYTRRFGPYFYPRFHLYINQETSKEVILTLHLDQKQPSYNGCSAHSGEYDGDLVENEAARIKNFISDAK
jgi:hypothetical protein